MAGMVVIACVNGGVESRLRLRGYSPIIRQGTEKNSKNPIFDMSQGRVRRLIDLILQGYYSTSSFHSLSVLLPIYHFLSLRFCFYSFCVCLCFRYDTS
jgi:hypothetical protein